MVSTIQVNQIYQDFIEGKITEKESINKILTIIINNKYFFGLEKLNDDSLYDYIYCLYPKIERSFETFDIEKSSFCSYLQNKTRMVFLTWKKNQMKNLLKDQAIYQFNSYEFTEKEESSIADFYPETLGKNSITDVINAIKGKIKKIDIYVIIMKSIYYITPGQLIQLVNFFSLDEKLLDFYIEEVKKSVENKCEKLNRLKSLTNKDFLKKEEMKIGLQKYDKDSYAYINCLNEYKKIENRYKTRKSKLLSMKVIPSDASIAKILNIPPSNVRYVLRKYYKKFDIKQ